MTFLPSLSFSISRAMLHITSVDAPVENLTRLSGGANMESSSFTHAGHACVLRRAPSPGMVQGRPFGHDVVAENSPIRRNVTIDDVGNVAAFLLSDLAAGVSAEITYVDGGFSQVVGGIAESA